MKAEGSGLVRGSTRFAAVLGWPVAHSASPALHNAAFAVTGVDAVMIALPVASVDLDVVVQGLAASSCLGASITVPHKGAVRRLCARVSARAEQMGAVNCLVFEGRTIVGHNTDADGFVDALREAGMVPAERRVVVLGAGGAACAVVSGLRAAGAHVTVVARQPEASPWVNARPWTELATHLAMADLLVDATSAGLTPANDTVLAGAVPLASLSASATVMSLVYHRRTELLHRAADRGLAVLDGRAMLVHQGARAFGLWTGLAAPVEAMRAALDDSLG